MLEWKEVKRKNKNKLATKKEGKGTDRREKNRKKIVSTLLIHNTSISLSINLGIIVKDLF